MSVINEYIYTWQAVDGGNRDWREPGSALARLRAREMCVKKFSWAIPNNEALDTIAKYGPIVELGAGAGYWAYLLRSRGIVVEAYDKDPTTKMNVCGYEFETMWTDVAVGDTSVLQYYSGGKHALMLCWPCYDDPFAYNALTAYKGNTLIYIGESWGGCTGDDQFFSLLRDEWECTEVVDIPRWDSIRDSLFVYKRK